MSEESKRLNLKGRGLEQAERGREAEKKQLDTIKKTLSLAYNNLENTLNNIDSLSAEQIEEILDKTSTAWQIKPGDKYSRLKGSLIEEKKPINWVKVNPSEETEAQVEFQSFGGESRKTFVEHWLGKIKDGTVTQEDIDEVDEQLKQEERAYQNSQDIIKELEGAGEASKDKLENHLESQENTLLPRLEDLKEMYKRLTEAFYKENPN